MRISTCLCNGCVKADRYLSVAKAFVDNLLIHLLLKWMIKFEITKETILMATEQKQTVNKVMNL